MSDSTDPVGGARFVPNKTSKGSEGVDKAPKSDHELLMDAYSVLNRIWVFFCDPVVVTQGQYAEARARLIESVESSVAEIKAKYPAEEETCPVCGRDLEEGKCTSCKERE